MVAFGQLAPKHLGMYALRAAVEGAIKVLLTPSMSLAATIVSCDREGM
jgi:hypothetical protein